MILDYPWYFILFCLLAGGAYAAAMYAWGRTTFGRGLRWLLAGLRFVVVTVIAFLLLGPMVRRSVHERQQPMVALVQDCSRSVLMSADSAFSLQPLGRDLDGHIQVHHSADTSNREMSDIGAMLDVPPGTEAIVLASDGIYNRGQNPATVAEQLGIPIYTVALGDTTTRRDAALVNLRANRIVHCNTLMTIEVTVNANHLRGKRSRLRISRSHPHSLLDELPVAYTDDRFSSTYTLTFKSGDRPGLEGLTLTLDEAEGGEETLTNNEIKFYVEVIDNRYKVAIVGLAPHPDLGALKHAVESNPNYEASVMLAADVIGGKHKELGECSMAILHNLPSARLPVPEGLKEVPQMYVIGMQTDLARFNAMKTGLEIVSRTKKSNDLTAIYNERFTLFHYDRSDGEALGQLPPLTAPFGEVRAAEGLQNLLTGRLGHIDTRQPMVAAIAQGGQRRSFVWGEGLWRWRMSDYAENKTHDHFDRLVSQLVAFTSQQEGRNRFVVEADRVYAAGQDVVLHAQLYNEANELTNQPEATLTLAGDSVKGDYTFARHGEGYTLTLGQLPEGTYRYTAHTIHDGKRLEASGSFAVEALYLEQADLTANHSLLRTISALTGGRMYRPDQMEELAQELKQLKPTIYTHTRYGELAGMPAVLILILLLLTAEWVLRKYHGEI